MNDEAPGRVQLVDAPGEPRTAATLLASLGARIGALSLINGSTAAASIVAGMALLGASVSRTAEGMRFRRALEVGSVRANGDRIWRALRLDEWSASAPPTPVIDQLRNDIALLLADDLEALNRMPLPPPAAGAYGGTPPETYDVIDYIVGLWALSKELVQILDSIAALTMRQADVTLAAAEDVAAGGPWLR
jgi:hypothetical protein